MDLRDVGIGAELSMLVSKYDLMLLSIRVTLYFIMQNYVPDEYDYVARDFYMFLFIRKNLPFISRKRT